MKPQLSAAKLALLEKRLRGQSRVSKQKEGIKKHSTDGPTILSSAQERLWFINQLHENNASDNISLAFKISGHLDCQALQRSFSDLFRRHETLRLVFTSINGKPHQLVKSFDELPFHQVNLKDDNLSHATVMEMARSRARKIFDLEEGPLVRLVLFELEQDEYILLLVIHHIISDGISLEILLRELSILYEANILGVSPTLPPLNIQYRDFSIWQKKWLEEKLEKDIQISYWKKTLSGQLPVMELPFYKQRQKVQGFNGAKYFFQVDSDLLCALNSLGKEHGSTLFMVLLSSLNVLLHRYTGNEDITVGAPVSGRNQPGLEGMIGLFLNMLVFRTSLSGDLSFSELLQRVRNITLEGYSHQEVPFEKLVEVIQPQRDLSRSPLFQVMMQVSNSHELTLSGLSVEGLELDSGTAQYDLALHFYQDKERLNAHFEYNTDLIDQSTVARMKDHFFNILHLVVKNPDQKISEIFILSDIEEKLVLEEWNATGKPFPREYCVHHLFENQVEKNPGKTALIYKDKKYSYNELNQKANKLAHYLSGLKVQPDERVGVLMERSPEMLISLIAVMKAGGSYLPLDPEFPRERLKYMMDDAGIRILLTTKNLNDVYEGFEGQVFHTDEDWPDIQKMPVSNLNIELKPTNLIYTIYTSGSTGKPKGVAINHRSVVNFLTAMQVEPGFSSNDSILHLTTISFDISALELFLPLISGGRLVMTSKYEAIDGRSILRNIKKHKISVLQATPSTWQMMIDTGWKEALPLKMLCGGEAMTLELAYQLLDRGGSLYNMYGPTETTIWSSVNKITKEESQVLIGKPIANTSFYILDKNRQPVPLGVDGELYIGGEGLARGYLNLPDLTNKSFVNNPFNNTLSKKLYKTGDLVKYHPNGKIEFIGRFDHQVKIRGFRIELGEVASTLMKYPAVKQAIAIVSKKAANDNKILVAYFIAGKDQKISSGELRDYMRSKLPEYLIPSWFIQLEDFPKTQNGKIDRKALPPPVVDKKNGIQSIGSATDELELSLLNIWKKEFNSNNLRVHDNFFEIGGHSLLAAQLFATVENVLGVKIPLAVLFEAPTVKQLAQKIRNENWKPKWHSLVPIKPEGHRLPLFLVHGAEGNILIYRSLAHHLGPEQPVYGLQSQGLNGEKCYDSLSEMASYYIKEIKKLQPSGPYYLGGYCMGGKVAFEMAQQLNNQGDKVALLGMLETYNRQGDFKHRTVFKIILHKLQNIKFHIENILVLPPKDQLKFITQKASVEKTRLTLNIRMGISKINSSLKKSHNGHNFHHVKVSQINDHLALHHKPGKYPGGIVLFKPKKTFIGADDPYYGWKEIAEKGVDVCNLPINPRGMLTEPFVKILAKELKNYLEQ